MGNLFICFTCFRTYTNKRNLNQPIKIKHEDTYKYTCFKTQQSGKRCKLQTNSKDVYTTHNVMYHGETPSGDFTCPKCQKTFAGKGLLSKHLKYSMCDTMKNFECPHCWKKYKKKNPWTNIYYCMFPGKKMQIVQLTSQ